MFPSCRSPLRFLGVGHTIVLLPWLTLDAPIVFGRYQIASVDHAVLAMDDAMRQTVISIGRTFINADGPTRPSVIWRSEDQTCASSRAIDLDEFNFASRLLALAILIENEFFTPFTPPTALNFDVVAQRFETGGEYFAIETRRREGTTLSGGYRFDATRFTRPVGAPLDPHLNVTDPLLVALAQCMDDDSPICGRVVQSAVPFLLANRLDSSSTLQSDLFWSTTAIEQLLRESTPTKGGITERFTSGVTEGLAGGCSSSARTMVRTWARELYGRRSDVHGRPHSGQEWSTGWHAFLASHAYGLLLKQLLTEADLYSLSDGDKLELEAFPRRIAGMRSRRLESAASVWSSTAQSVRWSNARRRMVKALRDASEKDPRQPAPE